MKLKDKNNIYVYKLVLLFIFIFLSQLRVGKMWKYYYLKLLRTQIKYLWKKQCTKTDNILAKVW